MEGLQKSYVELQLGDRLVLSTQSSRWFGLHEKQRVLQAIMDFQEVVLAKQAIF